MHWGSKKAVNLPSFARLDSEWSRSNSKLNKITSVSHVRGWMNSPIRRRASGQCKGCYYQIICFRLPYFLIHPVHPNLLHPHYDLYTYTYRSKPDTAAAEKLTMVWEYSSRRRRRGFLRGSLSTWYPYPFFSPHPVCWGVLVIVVLPPDVPLYKF
ncbi:uncharacterized protein F4807DRAFT_299374 [Annulohypoxylon truncatum]|uniref:uncharacterized protein n=1 Tax=Annulohypoxylon truncatum TaxID=327061 RepID=UPI002008BE93|nr:uncharacterized protein F4807DRAFT_299374 [Annulohypoxylon truncatum]KAI1204909.1 hypothetical protein F4807DRAFT_299374 [Annulohypoxylon truncatum]